MSRLRRARRDESGFTVVELAIVAALMTLVGLVVTSTVIGGLRTSARGEKRTDDAASAQRAMLQLTADLRATSQVFEATGTRVRVHTRSTGLATSTPTDVPEQVTYELGPTGDLVQTRQSGSTSTGTWQPVGTASVRTVLRGVLQPAAAGRPVFRYLSVGDSQRQCLSGPTTSTLGSAVAAADLPRIFSIDIWLSVNSAPSLGARPLVVPGGAVLANGGTLPLGPTITDLGLGQGC